MQAVLYIGHGSRIKKAADEAKQFIEKAIMDVSVPIQEICFLELSEPTIMEGVQKCVDKGATRIAVIPFLLLTAGHAKDDIPNELAKVKKSFPSVIFEYGSPLGVNNKLIDVLEERIKEQEQGIENATILLVGRGSSDPEQAKDFETIASRLGQRSFAKEVHICYLAANSPTFEEGLEGLIKQRKKVFVLPYLLFTGILMKGMEKKIKDLNKRGHDIVLCDYLGYHDNVKEVLIDRVDEILGASKR
jgi:sirohydrochlorin ferrochelatase